MLRAGPVVLSEDRDVLNEDRGSNFGSEIPSASSATHASSMAVLSAANVLLVVKVGPGMAVVVGAAMAAVAERSPYRKRERVVFIVMVEVDIMSRV